MSNPSSKPADYSIQLVKSDGRIEVYIQYREVRGDHYLAKVDGKFLRQSFGSKFHITDTRRRPDVLTFTTAKKAENAARKAAK